MWTLQNETDFSAAHLLSQSFRTGRTIWQVAVKGTFSILPKGGLEISEDQVEVFSSPEFREREDSSSIVYNNDLEAQYKDKTDVLINGHAYAPDEKRAKKTPVAAIIGTWSKQLKVVGNRYWDRIMGIMYTTEPDYFEKIPITYEYAFGGMEECKDGLVYFLDNPVGTGYAKRKSNRVGQALPNIEYPRHGTKKGKPYKNKVAGFGPLCGHWNPRIQYAGTYDKQWEENRFPLYPDDFNPRFYQCAPLDQQVPGIQGGEPVQLVGLTPGMGLLEFKLPVIKLGFFTALGKKMIQHDASLHSIIIEPDFPRLQMVWYTSVDCHGQEQNLDSTLIECTIKQL
ncbi:DUF2169 domain-containing protein [bacterium]|nr:DUF2169 domain-containing protein [bacterium]